MDTILIIGIPVSFKHNGSQYYINRAYTEYVKNAGHTPIIITPETTEAELHGIDAVLLTGGIDIDPIPYGIENIASDNVSPEMDRLWVDTVVYANRVRIPIFGICRGFQLLARLALFNKEHKRYEFYQHITEHPQSQHRDVPVHFAYGAFGKFPVNSMHHQALVSMNNSFPTNRPNEIESKLVEEAHKTGIAMETFASKKGQGYIVESAYFCIDNNLSYGVQWHPEELKQYELLNNYLGVYENDKTKRSNQ